MSSTVESSKTLTGIGAILTFLGFIPTAGPIIAIIGLILVLIGLKGLSEYYQDNSIYQNALWGVIYGIVAMIALAVIGALAGGFAILSFSMVGLGIGLVGIIAALIVAFIFFILMAKHFREAFYTLAHRSGENLFRTAGTLIFIGAILVIIVIGIFLIFIAWIIATIGFFTLKIGSQASTNTQTQQPAQTATSQVGKFCPYCGAPVDPNSSFCSHCGKQLS